jgi:ADP-heptose:LPS heptosyltransferase
VAVAGPTRPLLLVLRALGLGDFLTALPAFRALARAFPEHRRLLAAPPALTPLAALVPELDALLPARPLLELALDEPPDLAVNLHGRGPESHRVLLATRPRRLLAFRHDLVSESFDGPVFAADEHEVTRWCRLLAAFGVPADPRELELELPDPPLCEPGYALLHPGAASEARRWPPLRFAAVARRLARDGRRVLVSGDARERPLAEQVAREAGLAPHAVTAGRFDLRGLATLVRDASLLVCGDTGVAHLATALGTPSVVLFGPVPPGRWGPPPERGWHRALHRGGTGDPHGASVDARLLAIEVDEVLDAIAGLGPGAAPDPGAQAGLHACEARA